MPSPSISSGLQSPERTESPPPLALTETSPGSTPRLTSSELPSSASMEDAASSSHSRHASLASSATSSIASLTRRPKSYLGFPPLASMFRVRYPSTGGKSTVSSVAESVEESEESPTSDSTSVPPSSSAMTGDNSIAGEEHEQDVNDELEEDDRRTIRGGVSTPVSPVEENSPKLARRIGNGHITMESEEKKQGEDGEQSSPSVDNVIAHVK